MRNILMSDYFVTVFQKTQKNSTTYRKALSSLLAKSSINQTLTDIENHFQLSLSN